jgi:DNA-binding CsgD family transcriptional regulator
LGFGKGVILLFKFVTAAKILFLAYLASRQIHDKPSKMPVPSATSLVTSLLDELQQISEVISQNTDAAAEGLEAFRKRYEPFRHKLVAAKADLLTLTIASVRNNFDKQGIDDKKLVAWFKSQQKYDEAAQVLLSKARHFFMNGNLEEAEKVLVEIRKELFEHLSLRSEIVYYTRMAFLFGRKHQFDEQMKINLLALDKLKEMEEQNAWYYNTSTIFYNNIAMGYISNSDFERAWPYLQQSLTVVETKEVSIYNRYNVYSYFAFYYDSLKDHQQAAEWHEKIIALLEGDNSHQSYLTQAYLMGTVQYHLHYRRDNLSRKERHHIIERQEKLLAEAEKIIQPELTNGNYLQLLYAKATFLFQNKEYEKAEALLNQCLPVYEKMKNGVSILNCVRLAHELYHAWGKSTGDAEKLLKAYEFKQREHQMVQRDSEQSHLQKMEAAQVKHNLQHAELNSKLLKQQVEAQNKEIQLTALNLQEKVGLLDELKTFVLSLKKKDYEQKQLIQAIAQKIGAVKITEQDKAVLQQKIDDGNQNLFKIISEKYPDLTPHEVRTCGLLKTGMTNKELSRLYGLGERGYEQLRHRIKKKMNLKREDNLVKHLVALSADQ